MDGDGAKEKPFKCEWLAIKNHYLYAGGFGKGWTTPEGVFVNHDPQWVKRISVNGEVEHLDWHSNYVKLMNKVGIHSCTRSWYLAEKFLEKFAVFSWF